MRQTAATAKNDYEIAKQRQEEIEKQLADIVAQSRATSQVQVTLNGLESAASAYRKALRRLSAAIHGTTQQATFPITEARVISARLPATVKEQTQIRSRSFY